MTQHNISKLKTQCYYFGLLATIFAFAVIVLGAYTRLTDAGLGCPDWPGCYGHLFIGQNFQVDAAHVESFNLKKAWTEMAHRYLAGFLGLLIFFFCLQVFRLRRHLLKEKTPLLILPIALLVVLIFQALLGMWTVTLKLLPLVVMAHLMGGLTILSLLYWITLILKFSSSSIPIARHDDENHNIRTSKYSENTSRYSMLKLWGAIGIIVLLIQLFLGGWTSANYAALACLEFPSCYAGQYFPLALDLDQAFNLFALRNSAGITIHMFHRLGAVITALVIYGLCLQVYGKIHSNSIRKTCFFLALLLSLQICVGIMNVLLLLPLPIAVLHNAIAALLLLALIALNFQLRKLPLQSNIQFNVQSNTKTQPITQSVTPSKLQLS